MTRRQLARRRNIVASVAFGATLAIALALGASWAVAVSGAWGVAALLDFSRFSGDLVLLVTSVASLVAIFYLVDEAGKRHGAAKVTLAVFAVAVIVLSWLLVQTVYTVRYGDLYYGDPIGGIDFNNDDPPDYHDFLYLAFTIGMTYQVSDTTLRTRAMRRTAIRHAVLSFVFVTVILAVTINVVASLLK
jgi:uncharacterized membrane protein